MQEFIHVVMWQIHVSVILGMHLFNVDLNAENLNCPVDNNFVGFMY
jgi:hypothetical protein